MDLAQRYGTQYGGKPDLAECEAYVAKLRALKAQRTKASSAKKSKKKKKKKGNNKKSKLGEDGDDNDGINSSAPHVDDAAGSGSVNDRKRRPADEASAAAVAGDQVGQGHHDSGETTATAVGFRSANNNKMKKDRDAVRAAVAQSLFGAAPVEELVAVDRTEGPPDWMLRNNTEQVLRNKQQEEFQMQQAQVDEFMQLDDYRYDDDDEIDGDPNGNDAEIDRNKNYDAADEGGTGHQFLSPTRQSQRQQSLSSSSPLTLSAAALVGRSYHRRNHHSRDGSDFDGLLSSAKSPSIRNFSSSLGIEPLRHSDHVRTASTASSGGGSFLQSPDPAYGQQQQEAASRFVACLSPLQTNPKYRNLAERSRNAVLSLCSSDDDDYSLDSEDGGDDSSFFGGARDVVVDEQEYDFYYGDDDPIESESQRQQLQNLPPPPVPHMDETTSYEDDENGGDCIYDGDVDSRTGGGGGFVGEVEFGSGPVTATGMVQIDSSLLLLDEEADDDQPTKTAMVQIDSSLLILDDDSDSDDENELQQQSGGMLDFDGGDVEDSENDIGLFIDETEHHAGVGNADLWHRHQLVVERVVVDETRSHLLPTKCVGDDLVTGLDRIDSAIMKLSSPSLVGLDRSTSCCRYDGGNNNDDKKQEVVIEGMDRIDSALMKLSSPHLVGLAAPPRQKVIPHSSPVIDVDVREEEMKEVDPLTDVHSVSIDSTSDGEEESPQGVESEGKKNPAGTVTVDTDDSTGSSHDEKEDMNSVESSSSYESNSDDDDDISMCSSSSSSSDYTSGSDSDSDCSDDEMSCSTEGSGGEYSDSDSDYESDDDEADEDVAGRRRTATIEPASVFDQFNAAGNILAYHRMRREYTYVEGECIANQFEVAQRVIAYQQYMEQVRKSPEYLAGEAVASQFEIAARMVELRSQRM